jgi:hypothetical protein
MNTFSSLLSSFGPGIAQAVTGLAGRFVPTLAYGVLALEARRLTSVPLSEIDAESLARVGSHVRSLMGPVLRQAVDEGLLPPQLAVLNDDGFLEEKVATACRIAASRGYGDVTLRDVLAPNKTSIDVSEEKTTAPSGAGVTWDTCTSCGYPFIKGTQCGCSKE